MSMITGRWIELTAADGQHFKAWLAEPVRGPGPGIVLIQEIFGVNAHIQAVAEQYAADGYTVLAPDVYWRQQPGVQLGYDEAGWAQAMALMQACKFTQVVRDLGDVLAQLRALPSCSGKVAALGYCMGGRLAYHMAAETDVDAAVCYYGGGIHTALSEVARMRAPMLLHFAGSDAYIPPEAVDAVRRAFAGKENASIELYPAVDHGFNCWDRSNYNQRAAALARGRTLQFLAEHL